VVRPTNVNIDLVGGSGKEYTVNGVNYPSSVDPAKPIEPGKWRVEISRTTPGNVDFEFKLKVYDVSP